MITDGDDHHHHDGVIGTSLPPSKVRSPRHVTLSCLIIELFVKHSSGHRTILVAFVINAQDVG